MIFLDANYFINLYVKPNKLKKDKLHEKNHKRAKEIYKIIENKQKLISNLTIIEVITVLNVNQKQDPYLISKVYKDLNNNYDIVNDTVFHEKGFNILKNEFKKNKERLPLFDCIYGTDAGIRNKGNSKF
ncbi:MAG: PIN domain-containing protein [Firmicutes bacterium]|nr:PIN domain-containing protein [Bacillota bacterium]